MSRFNKVFIGICGRSATECKAEDCPDHGISKAVKELVSNPLKYGRCVSAEVIDRPCPNCGNPCPHELTDDLLSKCKKCGFGWI